MSVQNCGKAALEDVRRRTEQKLYPESIVYMPSSGKPELDSWIKPGSVVRIWASVVRNEAAVHQLFSAHFGDTTRLDHLIAEIVTHGPDGRRRDFDFGYMYTGGSKLGHYIRQYQGRIMSPDWVFIKKANSQVKHPKTEQLRLVAAGLLTESAWKRLKNLVESPESDVRRDPTDQEGRHVYDIRSPLASGYRAAVPWFAGKVLGGCHNCASFVMDLFGHMLTCVTPRSRLVVPGYCRSLPGGRAPSCTEEGLPLNSSDASSDSEKEQGQQKRKPSFDEEQGPGHKKRRKEELETRSLAYRSV